MDQATLYIFALIAASLTLLFMVLIISYLRLVRKYEEIKHGKDEIEVDPKVLVEKARQKSQEILEESFAKSKEIIAGADAYLKKEDNQMTKEYQKLSAIYSKKYEEAIHNSKIKAEQMIQNIPQDIKITLISAIDSFRISLSHEVNKAQQEANKAIKDAYNLASKEVDKYKEERMRQVDDSILSIVKDVTEKVLAKSVSTEEHEKLVQRALEESKKQKIF